MGITIAGGIMALSLAKKCTRCIQKYHNSMGPGF